MIGRTSFTLALLVPLSPVKRSAGQPCLEAWELLGGIGRNAARSGLVEAGMDAPDNQVLALAAVEHNSLSLFYNVESIP